MVYLNGEFLEKSEARLSPDDRGFLFGDGVYEVIRAYEGHLFQVAAHLERLHRSLRELRLQWDDVDHVDQIGAELLDLNKLMSGSALYYLQVTRGAAPRTHRFPPAGTPPTVYAYVSPFKQRYLEEGIRVVTMSDPRWGRCDIKTIALVPNVLCHQRGLDQGAEEVFFVRDGVLTEGSHNNLFGVFDGVVTTPPLSNSILAGITRRVVLALCRELKLPCREEPIPEERISEGTEFFIAGTGSEVTPVVNIDGNSVADGRPGPVTRSLQQAFRLRVAAETG